MRLGFPDGFAVQMDHGLAGSSEHGIAHLTRLTYFDSKACKVKFGLSKWDILFFSLCPVAEGQCDCAPGL